MEINVTVSFDLNLFCFTGFRIRLYFIHLCRPYHISKYSNWWRHKLVMHLIFNTNIYHSSASFTLTFNEKSSLIVSFQYHLLISWQWLTFGLPCIQSRSRAGHSIKQ